MKLPKQLLAAAAFTGFGLLSAVSAQAENDIQNFHMPVLGDRVYIFSPENEPGQVQAELDHIYAQQETNQFGEDRYAVFFLPGTYDSSIAPQTGFYTQIAGLGVLPTDTQIGGLTCLARWLGDDPGNHNACCNFWRSVENITIDSDVTWAVSQATSMRRVQINGDLMLHDEYGWASGGFLADARITGTTDSGSQQQWLSRNCDWKEWTGENWNLMFEGLADGSAPQETWPEHPYTVISETDRMREKPFLVYTDETGFGVYVPGLRINSTDISWEHSKDTLLARSHSDSTLFDASKDHVLPLEDFYVAAPEKSDAAAMNDALAQGKHLLLTPGIYDLSEPLHVTKPDTIILGIGLATLRPLGSAACLEIADESGIIAAGLLIDAGSERSEVLMRVGDDLDNSMHNQNIAVNESESSSDQPQQYASKAIPIQLSDLYFRVGGTPSENPAQTETCLVIHADDVIGDNFWIWRADHGDQVGWDLNAADHGLIVNGDRVAIHALMVEHFEKYQTIWNGNDGKIIMYQCEIPYDVPEKDRWLSHDGSQLGYASIYVDPDAEQFFASGLGIYLYNRDAFAPLHCAVEMPDKPGVRIEHICTVMLTGYPGMERMINDSGFSVYKAGMRQTLTWYENGRCE